jgi:uncharacterized protein YlxW (UPF0749 family)
MLMIVGCLISMAWINVSKNQAAASRLPEEIRGRLATVDLDLASEYARSLEELKKNREEVAKLREENSRLQNTLAQGGEENKVFNKTLQDIKTFAGLTAVEGPGVIVTLRDSRKSMEDLPDPNAGIIHDLDLLKVINELWNAGAEAISINGIRVGPTTSYRCVGTTILIDEQKIASPVVISAIGDSKTLLGAVNLPGGPLTEIRQVDINMVKVETAKAITMKAFSGSTSRRHATVTEAEGGTERGR